MVGLGEGVCRVASVAKKATEEITVYLIERVGRAGLS